MRSMSPHHASYSVVAAYGYRSAEKVQFGSETISKWMHSRVPALTARAIAPPSSIAGIRLVASRGWESTVTVHVLS